MCMVALACPKFGIQKLRMYSVQCTVQCTVYCTLYTEFVAAKDLLVRGSLVIADVGCYEKKSKAETNSKLTAHSQIFQNYFPRAKF